MNRFLPSFLAGAAGGAVMAFLIIALMKVLVLDPSDRGGAEARADARMDALESRIQRIELNSGQPDPRDAQRMGAPQHGALD